MMLKAPHGRSRRNSQRHAAKNCHHGAAIGLPGKRA